MQGPRTFGASLRAATACRFWANPLKMQKYRYLRVKLLAKYFARVLNGFDFVSPISAVHELSSRARIRTRGCWVRSAYTTSVLHAAPMPIRVLFSLSEYICIRNIARWDENPRQRCSPERSAWPGTRWCSGRRPNWSSGGSTSCRRPLNSRCCRPHIRRLFLEDLGSIRFKFFLETETKSLKKFLSSHRWEQLEKGNNDRNDFS